MQEEDENYTPDCAGCELMVYGEAEDLSYASYLALDVWSLLQALPGAGSYILQAYDAVIRGVDSPVNFLSRLRAIMEEKTAFDKAKAKSRQGGRGPQQKEAPRWRR